MFFDAFSKVFARIFVCSFQLLTFFNIFPNVNFQYVTSFDAFSKMFTINLTLIFVLSYFSV